MRPLIVGLGNPIMGDDAIGCRCAEAIGEVINSQGSETVEVTPFYRGGISLMERMIGYDRVLVIDSITGSGMQPGEVRQLSLDEIPSYTVNSPHDGSLKSALEFGKLMGEQLPSQVDILAVEIQPRFEFSEQLSPAVSACIPYVVQMSLEWVEKEVAVII